MDSGTIGVLGTVLGVLLGGPVTYYYAKILIQTTHKNAIELMRRQEFNKSAAEFKIAFIPELRYLDYRYSPERKDTPGIYKILSLVINDNYFFRSATIKIPDFIFS